MANGGIIGPVNIPTSTTATGVWQQEEQYEAKVTDTWPQRALFTTKSARFNNASSDYLNRTATSGNRQVSTFSGWVKKSSEGVDTNRVFLEYSSGTNYFEIRFREGSSRETIRIYEELNGSTGFELITNREFADLGAWYHIVVAIDTTQGTAANRIKLYINGVQETSFATETYPAQNYNVQMNVDNKAVQIGAYSFQGSNYFNGYMSEIIWVDGTQLAPTSFGVANSDGVWTPIPYSGTFGTNGFNLQFENAAALGTDSSPNGNTFTVNNLTSIDQTTDTPTNNYITLNPLIGYTSNTDNQVYSEGNTIIIPNSTDNYGTGGSTIGVKGSGKWYWEAQIVWNGTSNNANFPRTIGFVTEDYGFNYSYLGQDSESWGVYFSDEATDIWAKTHSSSNVNITGATTMANGGTVSLALDLDNGKFYMGYNGTFFTSGDPTSGASGTGALYTLTATDLSKYIFPAVTNATNSTYYKFNFGNPAYAISSSNTDGNGYGNFEYAVPSGYYSFNTANLAEFG